MSRMCEDCGVASWQPCQCDPRADLGHPNPANFRLPTPGEDDEPVEIAPAPPVPDFEHDPDADLPF